MSPEDEVRWRLAQLERAVEKLEGRGELETVDAAVQAAALLEQAEHIKRLDGLVTKLIFALVGFALAVAGSSVTLALSLGGP